MRQDELDALLLASGPNLFYFTGLPHGRSGSRPYILFLTAAGDAILMVHQARQYEARRFSRMGEIRPYVGLSRAPVRQIAAILSQMGIRRVGLEFGQEHYLDLQVDDLAALKTALRGVEFADAGALLWDLRKVKSAEETSAIARACAITGEAYEETFSQVRTGITEAHIAAMMQATMLMHGGGDPWALITSGPDNYDLVSKGGSGRVVEQGDMVWMDAGCAVEGYCSDFSRAGVIGGPSDEQLSAQERVHAITMAAVTSLRPGIRVAAVAAQCEDELANLDLPITSSISGMAERVGHGLGLVVTEWPSINRECPGLLETGMVVTIEPGVATSYGTFHVEQNILVTEAGPCVLSESPWQLRTLAP
jgi:Xaa-Pro aminopeptidase